MSDHRLFIAAALAAATAPSLACSDINTPIYFNGPGPSNMMPLLETTGQEMNNRITNGLTLRFRAPTKAEQADLDAQKKALGFDVPWVARDKIHLEVLFAVTNLDTVPGMFDVTVDGATQYTKYDENVVAAALGAGNNDKPTYLPLMSLHPMLPASLDPGKTFQGIFREDDFNEGAADLDAIGRWPPKDPMAAPAFPAVLINQKAVDPVGTSGVPADVVTPALAEVDVTLTAVQHMTCEWTVRVRDDDDRLWHDMADPHFGLHPTLFVPAAAP
jgi:hypothetical protein